jgi:ABC-type sugar transport system ATPase subunit
LATLDANSKVLVEVRGICKSFPGVQALSNVSAQFEAGQCHALMGENGAGKSTLGKIIAGLYRPDEGEVIVDGKPVHFSSPLDAQHAGISIVHQELLFAENLSVAENLSLSSIPTKNGLVDRQKMRDRASAWLAAIGSQVDPDALVGSLPIAQQQMVQIAGAIGIGARVLIFDEPTASLGQAESDRLLELIRSLKEQGIACVYVSHRLEEIFAVCDRVTVLRDGNLVGDRSVEGLTRDELVRMMIGREVTEASSGDGPGNEAEVILEVSNLGALGSFAEVSFQLRRGEILGIGGLIGAGRTELLEAIFGLRKSRGVVRLHGKDLLGLSSPKLVDEGLGLVPEDRKRHGLVLSMNCRENISLPTLGHLSTAGFVRSADERAVCEKYFKEMRVKAPTLDTPSVTLSGGNQQKLVIAKWLAADCEVLLVDEPTRGVDVGSKAEIHNLLRSLAAAGKGVIVVSSELPELMSLAHRILILRQGRVVGEELGPRATEESLMAKMAGLSA